MPTFPGKGFLIPIICTLLCTPGSLSQLTWTNIGPGGGGWLSAITVVNDQANTVYVGCDVGGIYKSTDNGRTWTIRNMGLSDYYVQDIAYDPHHSDTLYVATRGGVFKSTDGGDHWQLKRSGFPPENPYNYSAPVSDIAIDPVHPEILYAGIGITRAGYEQDSSHWQDVDLKGTVFKSINGAKSWIRIRETGIDPSAMIYTLAIDPATTSTLYAATDHGVYKSVDGGEQWQTINHGLPDHLHGMALVVDPLDTNILYVTMWAKPGSASWQGGVYKSTDGGQSWEAKNNGLPQDMGSEYGFTANYPVMVIDPQHPQTLYVGNTPWTPDPGVYKTIDGGEHWTWISRADEDNNPNVELGWITEHGLSVKCLAISPTNPALLYFGTSVHLFQSSNGGQNWEQAYSRPTGQGSWQGNGLETTCVQDIAIDPTNSDRVYAGYWDMGFLKSTDGGISFRRITEGMGDGDGDEDDYTSNTFSIIVDPDNPAIVYAAAGWWEQNSGGVVKSTDHGETWTPLVDGLPNATIWSIALDPASPVSARTMYAASYAHGIYKTTNGGQTWTQMTTTGLDDNNLQVRKIVVDANDSTILYAGIEVKEIDEGDSSNTVQGGLYRFTTESNRWTRLDSGQLSVWDIKTVSGHPKIIYTAVSSEYDHTLLTTFPGGVHKSIDGGQSWTRMNTGFGNEENLDVVAIAVHPAHPETLYAVTADAPYHDRSSGRGIFKTTDGGAHWLPINNGLGILTFNAITLDPANPSVLYAGSSGNGLFKAIDMEQE